MNRKQLEEFTRFANQLDDIIVRALEFFLGMDEDGYIADEEIYYTYNWVVSADGDFLALFDSYHESALIEKSISIDELLKAMELRLVP